MSNDIKIELDTARLDMLKAGIPERAENILEAAARRIETRAKESMKGGSTGAGRDARGRFTKGSHVPSAPGEPPHVDTGALRSSIHVEQNKPMTRDIMDGVEYGIHLEFGTTRMEARPWLTPAVNTEREPLTQAWKELCR